MNDKSLLIAGPGQHFAEATALRFAAEGFTIGLMGRNEQKLSDLSTKLAKAGVESRVFLADFFDDISLESALKDCAKSMPPWACIVYNVKQSHHGNFQSANISDMLTDVDANVFGAVRVVRAALAYWRRANDAAVLLAGGGYKDNPSPEKMSLSLSKGALHTLALVMQSDNTLSDVAVSEIVIDGEIGEETPLKPGDLADVMWHTYNAGIGSIAHFPE